MKLIKLSLLGVGCALIFGVYSCRKNTTDTPPENTEISASVLAQISKLGFSTNQVVKTSNGYIVEGDILLTESDLNGTYTGSNLNIAETEQYRTTNLVKNLPRVITISVTNLPTVYSTAVNNTITRYNALGLRMTFQRAAAGTKGSIDVIGFDQGPSNGFITLGSAGFPTSSGNPYNQLRLNTNAAAYGANPNVLYLTSVIQHEIGHCIGLRHTDYMNRTFSCGANDPTPNEGTGANGAILIPGTPSTPNAASFMLACSNGGDRTFNANDIVALNYLYK